MPWSAFVAKVTPSLFTRPTSRADSTGIRPVTGTCANVSGHSRAMPEINVDLLKHGNYAFSDELFAMLLAASFNEMPAASAAACTFSRVRLRSSPIVSSGFPHPHDIHIASLL